MRIAEVAPLYESVPPRAYGGTERIVSYITESLVELGHEVTLFASGDSVTAADLVSCVPRALRLDATCVDSAPHHIRMLELVQQRTDQFDVIHYHIDYLHFPLSRRMTTPHITTLHGRLDIPDLAPLYREFCETPLVSISDSQRAPLSWANWMSTVYHGLPLNLYRGAFERGSYLAFVGRVSPEKGLDRAIEIAKRVGVPFVIAAKVDKVDQRYFDDAIKPLLREPGIEFIGEISDADKQDFLSKAYALLFQIDWPEPFGLAMIEAMACGTPVIARRRGSVPEVVDEGLTGFIVEGIDEAIEAVERVESFDRRRCREIFERRFSAPRMATDYVRIFERLAHEWPAAGTTAITPVPGTIDAGPREASFARL